MRTQQKKNFLTKIDYVHHNHTNERHCKIFELIVTNCVQHKIYKTLLTLDNFRHTNIRLDIWKNWISLYTTESIHLKKPKESYFFFKFIKIIFKLFQYFQSFKNKL